MGHADHDLPHTLGTSQLDDLVHHRNQAFAAFQREALLADVAGMQVTLQPFGGHQPAQQFPTLPGIEIEPGALPLQPLLNPAFLGGVVDVHVFGTDGADVDIADQVENLAQRPLRGRHQRAGIEQRVHIGLAQTVVAGIQLRHRRPVAQAQRVEIGGFVATSAIGVDDAQHRSLLFGGDGT